MHLTIDARKAFDTGIGTHIREVVPRVIRMLGMPRVEVLVQAGSLARHVYLENSAVDLVQTHDLPFGLREQWSLRPLAGKNRLFWATTLAHPLYTGGTMVNTVHDVAQLGLPPALGGTTRQRWLGRPFFDSICRMSSLVLFSSEFTEAEFHRHVGRPRGPSDVVPLGVGDSWFMPAGPLPAPASDGPYFVMVGNLRPHKNLGLALRALRQVAAQIPHRLLLVGPDDPTAATGPELSELLRALAGRVTFTGPLEPDALRATLRGAEALLFPSLYEGFGLPVLEAMACGCPALVARNGVSPGVVGLQARSFDPKDASELADLMVAQASMAPADRVRLVQAGIDRARTLSWDKTAAVTASAIERVLSGRPEKHRLGSAA